MSSIVPPVPPTEKHCPKCNLTKPATEFYKSASLWDGLHTYCKKCEHVWSRRDKNPPPEGHKKCSACQQILPLTEFHKNRSTRDGHSSTCRTCYKARMNLIVAPEIQAARKKRKKRIIETLPEGLKRCIDCSEIKSVEAFCKQLKNSDGLHPYCKACQAERERQRHRIRHPVAIPTEKRCGVCKETKPIDEFYINTHSKSGTQTVCRECQKLAISKRRANSQGDRNHKSTNLKHFYGLTLAEYEAMALEQGGVCASCKQPETRIINNRIISLAVDHDHIAGKVRGLLCSKCNTALGLLEDDPMRIAALHAYILEKGKL